MTEKIEHFFADVFKFKAQIHQDLRGDAFLFTEQAEQQMFGAHIIVVQVARLFHRVFDHLLGARRLRQLAHGDHVRTGLDDFFDFDPDLAQIDVQILQDVCRDARAFLDQAQQDVFRSDVFMVEPLRFLVRQLHDLTGTIGESLVHGSFLSVRRDLNFVHYWLTECVACRDHRIRDCPLCRL